MKRILITGANSYVGTSFEKWLDGYPGKYLVDTVDMIGDEWREKDFSGYDVVFHVAGIAHVSSRANMKDLYYKVNRDLTIDAAKKAKADGVGQFIFMSSIIVYGDSGRFGEMKVITKDTRPKPTNYYGSSKLQAEKGIGKLQSDDFNVVILRPPMIYGKGSKGNYPKLAKLARWSPVFPDIENQRSMLYVDNLCEFIRLIVDNEEKGLFFPQNREYVSTSAIMQVIAEVCGRKLVFIKIFNPLIKLVGKFTKIIDKIFGNLIYEKNISTYKDIYQKYNFRKSIEMTEGEKF